MRHPRRIMLPRLAHRTGKSTTWDYRESCRLPIAGYYNNRPRWLTRDCFVVSTGPASFAKKGDAMRHLGLGSTQGAGRSGKSEGCYPGIALRVRVLSLVVVLAALAACLSSAPTALATTCNKYAASGVPSGVEGGNTNSGTEASPYKTLEKLEESLTAGQTGCLGSPGRRSIPKKTQTSNEETAPKPRQS